MGASASNIGLETIRQQLAKTRVGLSDTGKCRVVSSGLQALDRLLPLGGLPRGQITEMVGERGSGRTTLLLCAAVHLAAGGERTAIVDLDGDLDPSSFSGVGIPPGWVWVIRTQSFKDALWAADILIRSGHFGLVVLDGVSTFVPVSSLMRLQHGARESDAALVIGTSRGDVSAPGSLKIRLRSMGVDWDEGLGGPAEIRTARMAAGVAKGSGETTLRFSCRPWRVLSRHAETPDRRPAKWTDKTVPR